MAVFNDDISINSLIGAGSAIKGDIKINGFTRIDGDLDGNIETPGKVIIGEKARIRGNITARAVTVGGIIKGNIVAPEHVHLLSSSAVIGNIQTHHLVADENVILQGHCISLSDETSYKNSVSDWQNAEDITSKSINYKA
ncbi:MAG: polymer-forming cytoskeletal protein [Treponema sp.]|nr:polymer-forming cytoskeletal protein [Treponema sp.]